MSTAVITQGIDWPLPTTFTPRPFQLTGIRAAVERNYVFDVGLGGGKTTMSLAVAEALGAMRVLVLAPSKVIAVWRDEVAENSDRQWTVWHGVVQGARGPLKNPSVARRATAIIEANTGALRIKRPFMCVVNYEAVLQRPMTNVLMGTAWDMIICDESHKLAGAGAKTSRMIARITARCRDRGGRVILQTGTLMPHSALSLYGQFRALNPIILGSSWTAFKARYAQYRIKYERSWCPACFEFRTKLPVCGTCGGPTEEAEPELVKGPNDKPIPDGVKDELKDELMERVRPHILRVSQAELDEQTGLVEPPPQIRTCTLTPATRRVYDHLEKHLIARTADGVITAANSMVACTRLAQVTSGYGKDATTGQTIRVASPTEKLRLLADELEAYDVREPIIVFARFHHDFDEIRELCARQGRRYGEISGRRSDGLDGKVMDDRFDVVAVQPRSGGAGINLTRARIGIFYTVDFSLDAYDQCKRRILRQGQTRPVTYLHLVAEDTVDVSTFYALKKRRDVNQAVLDRLERRAP
jgi:SNF2 family DNA or RNA helicase